MPETTESPSSGGSRCAPLTGSVVDSRLAYIVCHLASLAKNLAVFGGIVWLAYVLQSGWVLWALLLCPWTRYKHDFGRRNPPNTSVSYGLEAKPEDH